MADVEPGGGESQPPAPPPGGGLGLAGIGFEFLVAILLPGAIGWWIDGKFGTRPWIMLAGGLLGFIAGLRLMMRAVATKTKR